MSRVSEFFYKDLVETMQRQIAVFGALWSASKRPRVNRVRGELNGLVANMQASSSGSGPSLSSITWTPTVHEAPEGGDVVDTETADFQSRGLELAMAFVDEPVMHAP